MIFNYKVTKQPKTNHSHWKIENSNLKYDKFGIVHSLLTEFSYAHGLHKLMHVGSCFMSYTHDCPAMNSNL